MVSRFYQPGAERYEWLFRLLTGATGPPISRPPPSANHVRGRLVLHWPAGPGGRGLAAHPCFWSAGARPRRSAAVSSAPEYVRCPVSAGPAVVLAGGFCARVTRRCPCPPHTVWFPAAQPAFDDAPLPDQRGSPSCGPSGHRLQLSRRQLGTGDRRRRSGPDAERTDHRLDEGLLGGIAPIFGRWSLRQLPDGGGP